ncbi:MAG: hypothetical protein Q7T55_01350 [Solirubrobacteraceae bacterium]|nr:hypothetical protein [Solirubrobacteraceae bacterium]
MPTPFLPASALRVLVAALLPLAGAATFAPSASAGTYTAWLCKTPPGTPAPLGENTYTSTEGWAPANSLPGDVAVDNTCGSNGSLSVNFARPSGSGTGVVGGGTGSWEFTAPSGTTVSTARMEYGYGITLNNSAADYYGESAVGVYRDGFAYDGNHLLMQRISRDGTYFENGVFNFAINATKFGFNTGCYGSGQCGTSDLGRSSMGIGWQQITLVDESTPTATNLGGSIMDTGTKRGNETFRFDAADVGSGARAVAVTLDGVAAAPVQLITPGNKRCEGVDIHSGIDREFAWARPCPGAVSGLISVDTTKVADGERLLTATLYDAAGNSTAIASRKVTVQNRATPVVTPTPAANVVAPTPTPVASTATPKPTPASGSTVPGATIPGATIPGVTVPGSSGTAGLPNGKGGAPATGRVTGVSAPKLPTVFGKPLSLSGRILDAAGVPLSGAFVDVFTTVDVPGASRAFAGTVTADGNGVFSYAVATKASQKVEFAYAAKQASTDYVDRASVAVAVRATVSLALVKQASRGRSVTFSGVVGVDPLPAKGVRLVIESKTAKGWLTAANVRTRKGGVFTWSHRFRTRGHYTFRARLFSASDLPAKVNQSPNRKLRIR